MTSHHAEPMVLGRYLLCDAIGGGGMAKVHVGRQLGAAGFSRVVAIKRLHPAGANDPDFTAMLVDEARLASRIRHPNVVPTLDVVAVGRELLLVMEYVHGIAVSRMVHLVQQRGQTIPIAITTRILLDVLAGLQAAHDATSERGSPLELVHRDISPQNIIVEENGVARIVDFGIAKAEGKISMTREGEIKGKLAYMAPEQLRGNDVDRRTDLYACGVLLWELATGHRLFERRPDDLLGAVQHVLTTEIDPPSRFAPALPPAFDMVVARALDPVPAARFATADEMAAALAGAIVPALPKEVAGYLAELGRDVLRHQREILARVEQFSAVHQMPRETSPSQPIVHLLKSAPPPAPGSAPSLPPMAGDPDEDLPKEKTSLAIVVLALTLSVLSFALILFVVVRRRDPAPEMPTASSASAIPSGPVPSAPAPVASLDAPPPEDEPPSQTPPHPTPSGHRKHRRTSPSAHPSASTASPDCDPPFTIDSRGIRIVKRECLKP